jgi:SAM-dependent methyltransferase
MVGSRHGTKRNDMEYNGIDNLEVMSVARNYNSFLVNAIVRQAGGRRTLLDFGAGIGSFSEMVKARGFEVQCFEVDPDLSKLLSAKGFRVFSSAKEVAAGSIDLVFSLNVLEHVQEDQAALNNFHTWIRPGGKLILYVPALMSLYTSMDEKVGHIRRYGRQELIGKASNAGFKNIECKFVDSIGFFATLAYKHFGPKDGSISTSSIRFYDRFIFPVSRALDFFASRFGGKNLILTADRS